MVVKFTDGDCYDESVLIYNDVLETSKETCRLCLIKYLSLPAKKKKMLSLYAVVLKSNPKNL